MKQLISSLKSGDVAVNGWIQSVRRMKNVAFADVSDGSTVAPLNVVFSDPKYAEELTTGSCVEVRGSLTTSQGRQQVELQASESPMVFGSAGSDYPLQKKYHSREFLRQLPHMRWKTRQAAQILRYRSWALAQLQQFFLANDVVQVSSPLITSSDCEGAGEAFGIEKSMDFFHKPAFLIVSSQLHLEVFASALSRVWNFTPAFRAEASDTNRHLSEFWMVEAELAFLDGLSDLTEFCENMTRSALPTGKGAADLLESKRQKEDKLKLEARWELADKKWTSMTYAEAIDLLNNRGNLYKLVWGCEIPSEHEKYLANELVKGPVVVTDYPQSIKPFYMKPSGEKTVACFDVLFPEIGEIVGGSMREDSVDRLVDRMRSMNMDVESLQWYVDLRKFGSFPHGGYGLGFDRLVVYLTGMDNIRDVTGFVRGYGQLTC